MKKANRARHSVKKRNPRPNSVNYYLYFSRASHKAGSIATQSFFQIRDFLGRDVRLASAQDFTDVISSVIPKSKPSLDNNPGETKKEDLEDIIRRSNEVLAEASTVFPFTLFPDTITVDRSKLILTKRTFFMTSQVLTIHIEDVLNIAANVGPFFGSLTVAIKGLTSEDHFTINFFKRNDAVHLKHIIQGHIMAQHDNIDYRHLDRHKLIHTLIELGKDSNPEKVRKLQK